MIAYCLPFSAFVSSKKAACVCGLACVVPVVPTVLLALELFTNVVSFIVRKCNSSGSDVVNYDFRFVSLPTRDVE